MIILEKPYVSEFLQKTVVDLKIPVLETEFSRKLAFSEAMNLLETNDFFNVLKTIKNPLLYSNSENSGELLNRFCPELTVTKNVNYFKNKAKLREIFSKMNPGMWYKTFSLHELDALDILSLKLPCVIKPVRGFASIGIHSVYHAGEWKEVLSLIKKEVALMRNVFPDLVVSLDHFLIEKYIEGTEIAIDAYFNEANEPVILNILEHLFASKTDMSDRLYLTSGDIIRKYHDLIVKYLKEISGLGDFRNFPFHLEMRQDMEGNIIPIEINAMRFMGFCVADVEFYFYGINPYEYYFLQKKPDWDQILSCREDKLFGMFGIDIPKHLDKNRITFNYDKFIGHFSNPLHHVKMDYRTLPVAIYLFAEVPKADFSEFESVLYSDLSEFIEDIK